MCLSIFSFISVEETKKEHAPRNRTVGKFLACEHRRISGIVSQVNSGTNSFFSQIFEIPTGASLVFTYDVT